MGLWGSCDKCMFDFIRNRHKLFSEAAASFCTLPGLEERPSFPTSSAALCLENSVYNRLDSSPLSDLGFASIFFLSLN